MNFSALISIPISTTSKPSAVNKAETKAFPISCMSPMTVPNTIEPKVSRFFPFFFISPSKTGIAFFITSAAITKSVINSSPRPKPSPTFLIESVSTLAA